MQHSDPLTAELVVDAAAAETPAISPDGRLVAYAVMASGGRGGHPHGSIWVTATDGSTAPRMHAARITTPVLILHGEEDTNVPLGQAIHFHRALGRFGAEHELVVYPREGHWIRERGHRLDVLRRIRGWYERWL